VPPTATAAPTAASASTAPEVEEKATKYEDVVGEWAVYDIGRKFNMRFIANGRCDFNLGVSIGKCSFVDGKLFWDVPETDSFCPNSDAYYDVYLIRQEGKTVKLRFEAVGLDTCGDRRNLLDGKTLLPFTR
jgi:hypothetical protein